jgi:four helix bundle protein
MAHKLEELPLFPKMMAFCDAVDTILARPEWRKDRRLHEQIGDANDSVSSNMHEGFEQPSDAAFAVYVYRSKASTAEVVARLKRGLRKRLVTGEDFEPIEAMADELCRMFGGFIKYLESSRFTDRGRHRVGNPPIRDSRMKDSRIKDSG